MNLEILILILVLIAGFIGLGYFLSGRLKNLLREEQLQGKIKNKLQASGFLKKQFKSR